jgi:hypothetical protein
MTSWLLVEQPGPWSSDAAEHTFAAAFAQDRLDRARAKGLRPLLIRRPGKHHRREGAPRTVFIACGLPGKRWVERKEVRDLADLAALDLDAVTAGRGGHGEPASGPLFLICTHGTKDMCCALLGRPVVARLATEHTDRAWEVSHLGGDRWAGNLLVIPGGYLHGQLTPDDASRVAQAAVSGQVLPGHLRGRTSAASPWEQYAEIVVRQHTGLYGLDAVTSLGCPDDAVETAHAVTVLVQGGNQQYRVTVRSQARPVPGKSRCSQRLTLSDFAVEDIRPLVDE